MVQLYCILDASHPDIDEFITTPREQLGHGSNDVSTSHLIGGNRWTSSPDKS